MAVGASSCFVSSCRISHFGANPVSGGRPPNERRIKGVSAVMAGIFDQEVAKALIVVALFSLKTMKVEKVIRK